ncbi:uncharacterized protein A4U43_C03F24420 [Asparagus officinalis]|uniref:Uncharacterized protein n=1 Tax=Asparagus officinalis TaxID=4686 RepID=A0A5P1FCM2_ASPOF|nr:uncharacterized protein A4U43_C03F24420 [Asparagus officinalis]
MVRRSVRLQVTESQSAMDKATARKAALVADQYGISTGVGDISSGFIAARGFNTSTSFALSSILTGENLLSPGF